MNEKMMTLCTDWTTTNVDGWWMMEKLNGCRAFWDGTKFWTRDGNVIKAPAWFTKGLPHHPLDGEIWAGQEGFECARVAVQFGGNWFKKKSGSTDITFTIFDAPTFNGNWQERMVGISSHIEALRRLHETSCFNVIPFTKVAAGNWIDYALKIRTSGGEGLIFRNPNSGGYEIGRTKNLQRFKFCR